MATRFADVSNAIQAVHQQKIIAIVSKDDIMSNAEAICQEFCEEVLVGSKVYCSNELSLSDQPLDFEVKEELKCTLGIEHLTGLVERMMQVSYCCTQVQTDRENKKCIAWFEPKSLD